MLKKDGHVEIEPLSFCKTKHQDTNWLLVIIRNEDISSHIHKVRAEAQAWSCPAQRTQNGFIYGNRALQVSFGSWAAGNVQQIDLPVAPMVIELGYGDVCIRVVQTEDEVGSPCSLGPHAVFTE